MVLHDFVFSVVIQETKGSLEDLLLFLQKRVKLEALSVRITQILIGIDLAASDI